MIYKVNDKNNIDYLDTLLISLILTTITIPFLWILSQESIGWVASSAILWAVGVFSIFYPFVRYIFPMMLTKLGTLVLTAILALITLVVNLTTLIYILPSEDIEFIFNQNLFRDALSSSVMFVWFYILVAGTVVTNLSLKLETVAKKHKELIRTLRSSPIFRKNLIKHYSELLLIFILPIALLFWIEVTFSTRALLAIISMSIGVWIFIDRLNIEFLLKRVASSVALLITVMVINISFVNTFGFDMLPSSDNLKVRIAGNTIGHNAQATDIAHPSYQINSSKRSREASLYKIVSSIPQIGLHIGYRIATVPNETIVIKATDTQYSVENQYEEKFLNIPR